jgi:hypothetical protein
MGMIGVYDLLSINTSFVVCFLILRLKSELSLGKRYR